MVERGDGVLRLPAQAIDLGGVLVERGEAFLSAHRDRADAIKRILTLNLATVREDGEPARRRAPRSEFSDDEWRLVGELADHPNRLVVTAVPEGGGEAYAEIAHETVFRRWDRLREWITEAREFLIWKSAIEADRRSWSAAPARARSGALLAGLKLAQAQAWLRRGAADVERPERDFIAASRRAARRRLARLGHGSGRAGCARAPRRRRLGGVRVAGRTPGRGGVGEEGRIGAHPGRLLRDGQPGRRAGALRQRGAGASGLHQSLRSRKVRGDAGGMAAGHGRARGLSQQSRTVLFQRRRPAAGGADELGRGATFVRLISFFGRGRYRLPSESEYEYAARAGTTASRYWGDNIDDGCSSTFATCAWRTAASSHRASGSTIWGFGWPGLFRLESLPLPSCKVVMCKEKKAGVKGLSPLTIFLRKRVRDVRTCQPSGCGASGVGVDCGRQAPGREARRESGIPACAHSAISAV